MLNQKNTIDIETQTLMAKKQGLINLLKLLDGKEKEFVAKHKNLLDQFMKTGSVNVAEEIKKLKNDYKTLIESINNCVDQYV
jgi:hypothetical protein